VVGAHPVCIVISIIPFVIAVLKYSVNVDSASSMTKVTAFALYSSVKLRRVEPILSSPD